MAKGICSVEGCPDPADARGWCKSHYNRWKRHGDPLGGKGYRGRRKPSSCSVPDCPKEVAARSMCSAHYVLWRQYGDPLGGPGSKPRQAVVGYEGMHHRLKRDLGSAKNRECVLCGATADHWAYDHSDPDELVNAEGKPYSLDADHYMSMCVTCHNAFDRRQRKAG